MLLIWKPNRFPAYVSDMGREFYFIPSARSVQTSVYSPSEDGIRKRIAIGLFLFLLPAFQIVLKNGFLLIFQTSFFMFVNK
ncbi:hypothetical protein EV202_101146 [Bacteroides heparinolyticus]|uniref:Uncharacterized protein n=1 Tax=Prevotella heparinolytica TaxID=28113 RepID=A0A4R2M2H4_9BACE|nr:hypothetical protein EV202_101146 [Bacteroides heparinolyticus]